MFSELNELKELLNKYEVDYDEIKQTEEHHAGIQIKNSYCIHTEDETYFEPLFIYDETITDIPLEIHGKDYQKNLWETLVYGEISDLGISKLIK